MKNTPLTNFASLHASFFGNMTDVIDPQKELWTLDNERVFVLFFRWCRTRFPEDDAYHLALIIAGLLELPMVLDRFNAVDRENYKKCLMKVDPNDYVLFTANLFDKNRLDCAIQVAETMLHKPLFSDQSQKALVSFESLSKLQKITLGQQLWQEVRTYCVDFMTTSVR